MKNMKKWNNVCLHSWLNNLPNYSWGNCSKHSEDSELEDAVIWAFTKNKRKCSILKSFNCLKFKERHSRSQAQSTHNYKSEIILVK